MIDRSWPYGTLVDDIGDHLSGSVWNNAFWQGFQNKVDRDPALGYYTVAWTSVGGTQPSLGNGTLYGIYTRKGSFVAVRIALGIGSTTDQGTGGYWQFSLPVASAVGAVPVSGWGHFRLGTEGSLVHGLYPQLNTSSTIYGVYLGNAASLAGIAGPALGLATNDDFVLYFHYQGVAP